MKGTTRRPPVENGPDLVLAGSGRRDSNRSRWTATCKAAHIFAGAEVEVSVPFAEVRGSTGVAERMSPADFRSFLNRFFEAATQAADR